MECPKKHLYVYVSISYYSEVMVISRFELD